MVGAPGQLEPEGSRVPGGRPGGRQSPGLDSRKWGARDKCVVARFRHVSVSCTRIFGVILVILVILADRELQLMTCSPQSDKSIYP